jgi:outer membrane protein OmpA-like peptidoglycan-associated protein
MRLEMKGLRDIGLLTVSVMMFAVPATSAYPQDAITTESMVSQLSGLETSSDMDVAALRQRVLDRVKSKADGPSLKRPPVTAELLRLPHFDVAVQFNPDSPIIRPESYRMLGRIADALYDPTLSSYGFLIVGHTESTGRREYNLTLSQRRADSIRDVLVTTFKISPKRIQAVGLGEEQLQDAAHPTAAANQQLQVLTFRKTP